MQLPIYHIPVLKDEVIEYWLQDVHGCYCDGTTGEGGHSLALLDRLGSKGHLLCLDRNAQVQEIAKQHIQDSRVSFALGNFGDLDHFFPTESLDGLLLDLGISMFHYKQSQRGFSFFGNEPLSMNLDGTDCLVEEFLSWGSFFEIKQVLKEFGEEKLATPIAKAIIYYREHHSPIKTTAQLVEIVTKVYKAFHVYSKHHPATKTFQALRIQVNQEFKNINRLFSCLEKVMKVGGVVLCITYHSLEDKQVEKKMNELKQKKQFKFVKRQPILPREEEINRNLAARSAKLRVIKKI